MQSIFQVVVGHEVSPPEKTFPKIFQQNLEIVQHEGDLYVLDSERLPEGARKGIKLNREKIKKLPEGGVIPVTYSEPVTFFDTEGKVFPAGSKFEEPQF